MKDNVVLALKYSFLILFNLKEVEKVIESINLFENSRKTAKKIKRYFFLACAIFATFSRDLFYDVNSKISSLREIEFWWLAYWFRIFIMRVFIVLFCSTVLIFAYIFIKILIELHNNTGDGSEG